jgi:hypothetical protein
VVVVFVGVFAYRAGGSVEFVTFFHVVASGEPAVQELGSSLVTVTVNLLRALQCYKQFCHSLPWHRYP